jgi:hypothetical protein
MASRGGGRNRIKDAQVPEGLLTGRYPVSTAGLVLFKSACRKRSPHLASILCRTSNLELTIMPGRDHE